MNVNDCIKDYLMNAKKRGLLDVSLAHFFRSVNDPECGMELKRRVDAWNMADTRFDQEEWYAGNVLSICQVNTKEEKYRDMMDQIHAQYKKLWQERECLNNDWVDILYRTGPFMVAYDTAFQNKEHYNEIIEKFEDTYGCLNMGENISLPSATKYVMALIDAMDVMSKEIFEHYKTLERLFKNTIQSILKIIKNENNIYQAIDKREIESFALGDLAGIAYAVLKACRMKVLLSEKYQATGMDLVDYILGVVYDIQDEKFKLAVSDEVMAVFIMAYAQKLMLESKI